MVSMYSAQNNSNGNNEDPNFGDNLLLLKMMQYESSLEKSTKNLYKIHSVFKEGDVWPDQCEYAIQLLKKLRKSIISIAELLSENTSLSKNVIDNRYSILIKTNSIDTEINKLAYDLSNYESLCRLESDSSNERLEDIQFGFDELTEKTSYLKAKLSNIFEQDRSGKTNI